MTSAPNPEKPEKPTRAARSGHARTGGATARPPRGARGLAGPAALAIALIVLDQLTKAWAEASLAQGRSVRLVGHWLYLALVYNRGAAFSLGESSTLVISLVAVAAVVAIPVVLVRRTVLRGAVWGLALVWAGAAGNLIDRLTNAPGVLRGHVVDFIGYGTWFVGNVADIVLFVGVVVLAVAAFRGGDTREVTTPGASAPEPTDPGASAPEPTDPGKKASVADDDPRGGVRRA